jgi:hypothetical protein
MLLHIIIHVYTIFHEVVALSGIVNTNCFEYELHHLGLKAGMTGQHEMPTLPRHLVLSLVGPQFCVCPNCIKLITASDIQLFLFSRYVHSSIP